MIRFLTIILFFSFVSICQSLPANNPSLKTPSISAFIENKGQIIDQKNNPNPDVLYLLNTPGFNVQLRRWGFSYDLYSPSPNPSPVGEGRKGWGFHRIDITLQGANPECQLIPSDPLPDYFNYFTASAPSGRN